MLYRILGIAGSGTSTSALDRVVNSKYDNVLLITNEVSTKTILKKLENYTKNTKKVIVNNITVKAVEYGNHDVQMDLMMEEAIGKYDCILIDRLEGIGCSNGECVISPVVFYDDLCEKYAFFSTENDIDVITTQHLNGDFRKYKVFDEAMEEFCKEELPDNQEFVLNFRSLTENDIPFTKIYERRNNLIRSFDINKYFKQNETTDKSS